MAKYAESDGSDASGSDEEEMSCDAVASPAPTPMTDMFNIKSRVKGNWQGAGQWFPGTVVTINGGGTYAVQYDDGDYDESVPDSDLEAM